MKTPAVKRAAGIIMSLMMCLSFAVTVPQEADAASRTKTYQLVTSVTKKSTHDGTSTYRFYYDKNGLRIREVETFEFEKEDYSEKRTIKYVHGNNGFPIKSRTYDKDGSFLQNTVYSYKYNADGEPVTARTAQTDSYGKYEETSYYKYWSRGKVKQHRLIGGKTDSTTTYNKKGDVTEFRGIYGRYTRTNTYDGDGNLIKCVEKGTAEGDRYVETTRFRYTYRDGMLVRCVAKKTSTVGRKDEVTVEKDTYTSRGNISKREITNSYTLSDGSTEVIKSTLTFKYTNVRVPEKYWNAVNATIFNDSLNRSFKA